LELGFVLFSRVDLSYFRQPNGTLMAKEFNKKKVVFAGVDTDKTYTVLVTLGKFWPKSSTRRESCLLAWTQTKHTLSSSLLVSFWPKNLTRRKSPLLAWTLTKHTLSLSLLVSFAKEFNKKKVVFAGMDTDKTYTVLVTLGKIWPKSSTRGKSPLLASTRTKHTLSLSLLVSFAKEFNKKKVVFAGVDTDKTYTVLVTLGKF
jgi:hypothetical protein